VLNDVSLALGGGRFGSLESGDSWFLRLRTRDELLLERLRLRPADRERERDLLGLDFRLAADRERERERERERVERFAPPRPREAEPSRGASPAAALSSRVWQALSALFPFSVGFAALSPAMAASMEGPRASSVFLISSRSSDWRRSSSFSSVSLGWLCSSFTELAFATAATPMLLDTSAAASAAAVDVAAVFARACTAATAFASAFDVAFAGGEPGGGGGGGTGVTSGAAFGGGGTPGGGTIVGRMLGGGAHGGGSGGLAAAFLKSACLLSASHRATERPSVAELVIAATNTFSYCASWAGDIDAACASPPAFEAGAPGAASSAPPFSREARGGAPAEDTGGKKSPSSVGSVYAGIDIFAPTGNQPPLVSGVGTGGGMPAAAKLWPGAVGTFAGMPICAPMGRESVIGIGTKSSSSAG